MLGWHWLAWGEGCEATLLAELDRAQRLLEALAEALALTVVGPVQVHAGPSGVVGVVLLAESHASVHACPAQGTLFVDVFSCAGLDSERALEVVAALYPGVALSSELTARGPGAAGV